LEFARGCFFANEGLAMRHLNAATNLDPTFLEAIELGGERGGDESK
jgi:hypothetical protein